MLSKKDLSYKLKLGQILHYYIVRKNILGKLESRAESKILTCLMFSNFILSKLMNSILSFLGKQDINLEYFSMFSSFKGMYW